MKLLHKGKVKEVFEFGEDKLLFNFTDQISVFDKIIPTLVPKKGEALNRTSAFWFETCSKLGIDTHYLGMQEDHTMLVKRVDIIRDYAKINKNTRNFLIPLEVICRHYIAGSMYDRIKSGEVKPETLGLPAGTIPKKGAKLPKPFIEFTTKLEPVDRPLSEEEAQRISSLTDEEFQALKDATLLIDAKIGETCEKMGLIHVDGKKEFGMNAHRELMLVDTFGTPDEDRWWDKELADQGQQVELSKEMVRQHYRSTGYFDQLMAARKAGEAEPPIPPLPDEVTKQVTDLYVSLYERITGRGW